MNAVATADGTNLFRIRTGPTRGASPAPAGRAPARTSRSACPTRSWSTIAERMRDPDLERGRATGSSSIVEGVLFADARRPTAGGVAAGLPVVDGPTTWIGRRSASARTLDPVDLDAATRLASLVPADVGSVADVAGRSASTTRTDSWSRTLPELGWAAVFGFYTPTPAHDRADPRARSACCAACSSGARPTVAAGHPRRSRRDGTYVPRRPTTATAMTAAPSAAPRVAAVRCGRVALPKPSGSEDDDHVLLPLRGPPRGRPGGARPQRQRQLRVQPLLGRGDPRRARLGPRGRPCRARRRLRQSHLHQRLPHQRDRRRAC